MKFGSALVFLLAVFAASIPNCCNIAWANSPHDVAVISVVPGVPHEYPGRIVNITVVVRNNGTGPETFNVTAYRDSTQISKILVTNLNVNESKTLVFHWNTSGLTPCHTWKIGANATLAGDTNPTNNGVVNGTVKIKMLGDANASGLIDVYDLVIVAAAYGSKKGGVLWDPNADIYYDGQIDIWDAVLIGQHFGETCPKT